MKNLLITAIAITLSGCATVPREGLSWQSGDVSISARRDGCELVNIEIKNNGSAAVKASGEVNILDAQSNTISTVSFYCDSAFPGGTAMCRRSQKYNDKLLYAMPGLYCAGYSQYKMSVRKY